ncbi:hypothetical protein pb186bvf_002525 [Paramecium bursaria]
MHQLKQLVKKYQIRYLRNCTVLIPGPPPKPLNPYLLYLHSLKDEKQKENLDQKILMADICKLSQAQWQYADKEVWQKEYEKLKLEYFNQKRIYENTFKVSIQANSLNTAIKKVMLSKFLGEKQLYSNAKERFQKAIYQISEGLYNLDSDIFQVILQIQQISNLQVQQRIVELQQYKIPWKMNLQDKQFKDYLQSNISNKELPLQTYVDYIRDYGNDRMTDELIASLNQLDRKYNLGQDMLCNLISQIQYQRYQEYQDQRKNKKQQL